MTKPYWCKYGRHEADIVFIAKTTRQNMDIVDICPICAYYVAQEQIGVQLERAVGLPHDRPFQVQCPYCKQWVQDMAIMHGAKGNICFSCMIAVLYLGRSPLLWKPQLI